MSALKYTLIATTAITTLISPLAHAGETEDRIIDNMIEAYGGDTLKDLKSVTLYSDLRYNWLDQGHTSDFVDLAPMRKIHEIDLIGQRGSEDAWGSQGAYNERVIGTNSGQITINYNSDTYTEDKNADFYSHFGVEMRGSDTLMAYDLMKNRDKAVHKGQVNYQGRTHNIIEYDMVGTSYEPQIWIDSTTGHITRISRDIPGGKWHYIFDNFKTSGGVTYADDFTLYYKDILIEYAKSRKLSINDVKSSVFETEAGLTPAPETFETPQMHIEEHAPNVQFVGQGRAFTGFVDAGDFIVGFGSYEGLKERFQAYQKAHGKKPLKYQIITHHHTDHMLGAADALELGAILVVPPSAVANLRKTLETPIPRKQLLAMPKSRMTFGPVVLHLVSTSHVQDYGLVYIPSAKSVYQADHYNGNFKTQPSPLNHAAMSLKAEIERLGLDVDTLYSTRTRRAESWKAFEAMAEKYVPGLCPTGREICRDLN